MANPQNLKPFKKGVDPRRNVKGRPKVLPPLEKLLIEVLGSEDDQKSQAQAVLNTLLARAKKGDVRAAEILLDRAYGKPKQSVDLTSNGESIHTTVVIQDPRGQSAAE
jgi:hypothetical protein